MSAYEVEVKIRVEGEETTFINTVPPPPAENDEWVRAQLVSLEKCLQELIEKEAQPLQTLAAVFSSTICPIALYFGEAGLAKKTCDLTHQMYSEAGFDVVGVKIYELDNWSIQ